MCSLACRWELRSARCLIVRPDYTATVSYSTIYPTPRTPSSLAWVQRTQAGLRPNSARKLAVGPPALGHHNPTVCSLAYRCRLQSALRADHECFSIEIGPLLDNKARLYSSELSYCYCILLHHLSYTSDTILHGLGTAHASWPSAKLCTQAGRMAFGPTPSQSYSLQPCLPLAATIGPAGRSSVFFY